MVLEPVGVDDVERTFGQRVVQDVVSLRADIGGLVGVEQCHIDIGRKNTTRAADLSAEPRGDGAAACTDFRAAPAFPQSERAHAAARYWLEILLE
jgi:hypothetical protein